MKVNKYLNVEKIDINKQDTNICGHVGVGGQKGWIYGANGIAPTVPATSYKDPVKVIWNERNKLHNGRLSE